MTVQARDFVFNGVSLSSFSTDYLLVSFDTSADESNVSIIDTSVNHSDLNYNSPIVNFYNRLPSEVLSFDITICRSDGLCLEQENIRELQNWLFAPKSPKVAYFIPYDNDEYNAVYNGVEFIGVFSSSSFEQIGQVNKIGISFTFTNVSPYAFTPAKTYHIDAPNQVDFNSLGSHVGEIIYPKITITPIATGTLKIVNQYGSFKDDPLSINVTSGQTVIIKDRNLYLSDGSLYSFNNLNNYNWIDIIDGKNSIIASGVTCSIDIEIRYFENIGV